MHHWTLQQASETYAIERWGEGYFHADAGGRLRVRPGGPGTASVALADVVAAARGSGLSLPLLVRFPGILHHRVAALRGAFARAMAAADYAGPHVAVYPVKVNQQRRVVEEILAAGGVGLEAGSKPELMAVLALAPEADGIVVCNGYKDREYVRLALMGRALGLRTFIVVEKLSELERVLAEARDLGIEPLLGVRVRLASIGRGKWQNTGGEKAKFGLQAEQLLAVVERLRAGGGLDTLRLLHVHMGSQIANIRDIQRGLRECARYYAELRRLGAPVEWVDVGGGLSVDYEGTRSRREYSMNYTVQEYANNVVQALAETCAQAGLPQPGILTESGRAMTAHHAVLVTEVVDIEHIDGTPPPPPAADDPPQLRNLHAELAALEAGGERSPVEAFHDAAHWLAEVQAMYVHGVADLDQRARAERCYQAICRRVQARLDPAAAAHREVLDELNEKLADKYFCNFSLFQSLPDVWAIDQIFPVVPLARLDERPDRRAVIEDLTCDSDGRIDHYVDRAGVESTLPVHAPRTGERYLLGMFLVGAYQEILGDMHNLFGDTHSVHVAVEGEDRFRLEEPLHGDSVAHVLELVHFDPEELRRRIRDRAAAAGLPGDAAARYLAELEAGLAGYTYLED